MRFSVERSLRSLFHLFIGFSLILVITPSLSGALPGTGAALWPLIGLLAYLLHLFEDTGKLSAILRSGWQNERRSGEEITQP
jgi:hypothetical protein